MAHIVFFTPHPKQHRILRIKGSATGSCTEGDARLFVVTHAAKTPNGVPAPSSDSRRGVQGATNRLVGDASIVGQATSAANKCIVRLVTAGIFTMRCSSDVRLLHDGPAEAR